MKCIDCPTPCDENTYCDPQTRKCVNLCGTCPEDKTCDRYSKKCVDKCDISKGEIYDTI